MPPKILLLSSFIILIPTVCKTDILNQRNTLETKNCISGSICIEQVTQIKQDSKPSNFLSSTTDKKFCKNRSTNYSEGKEIEIEGVKLV